METPEKGPFEAKKRSLLLCFFFVKNEGKKGERKKNAPKKNKKKEGQGGGAFFPSHTKKRRRKSLPVTKTLSTIHQKTKREGLLFSRKYMLMVEGRPKRACADGIDYAGTDQVPGWTVREEGEFFFSIFSEFVSLRPFLKSSSFAIRERESG